MTTGGTSSRAQPSGLRRIGSARRLGVVPLTAAVTTAALIGFGGGRWSAPDDQQRDLVVVEREIVPLSVDADALWTAGTSTSPPIGEQLAALRRDPSDQVRDAVLEAVPAWLDGYDRVLRRLVGIEVPDDVRPVQRQFVTATVLSRDAVELLAAAAAADGPNRRRDLSSEALRLRTRSEQLTQTARASVADLSRGPSVPVAEPEPLPSLEELR